MEKNLKLKERAVKKKVSLKESISRFANWISRDYNVCISCGMDCDVENRRYALCTSCMGKFKFAPNICLKCGCEYNGIEDFCDMCKNKKRYFKTNRSCFPYRDEAKDLILSFKFNSTPYKAKFISSFLIDKYLDENYNADIVTFVPMSKDRLRERGYNQSYLLAKSFAERMNMPLVDLLNKKNKVKKQEGLSYKERVKSAEDAFSIKKENISEMKGKVVLIIDDVFTTGSTMSVLSKILLENGAYEVLGLTVCGVPFSANPKKKSGS